MNIRNLAFLAVLAAAGAWLAASRPARTGAPPSDFRDVPYENPVRQLGEKSGLLKEKPGQRFYKIDYKEDDQGEEGAGRDTAPDFALYQECYRALGGGSLKELGVDLAYYSDGTRKALDKSGKGMSDAEAAALLSKGIGEKVHALYSGFKAGKADGEADFYKLDGICARLPLSGVTKSELREMKRNVRDI